MWRICLFLFSFFLSVSRLNFVIHFRLLVFSNNSCIPSSCFGRILLSFLFSFCYYLIVYCPNFLLIIKVCFIFFPRLEFLFITIHIHLPFIYLSSTQASGKYSQSNIIDWIEIQIFLLSSGIR